MLSPSYMVLRPPHFFVVVLKLNLRLKKLRIPESFVKDYGKFLSSCVTLKLPDGKEWTVGLTTATTNGAVWLQNGWDRFAEYYGLEFGSFLVFRFDGNSSFHTTIFKMDGSEIKYYCRFEEDDEDDSGEKKDKVSFWPKIEPQEEGCNIFHISKKLRRPKDEDELNSKESERPCFRVVMTQSNVGGRFDMIIPTEFAAKHFSDEFGIIRLRISNCKTWSLVYKWDRNQANFAYISSGWRRFAEENLLKEGDIGFFQLTEKNQFLFTKLQLPSPIIPTTTTTTKNPFFEVIIHSKKHSRNHVLNVPRWFSREHLSPKMKTAELEVGEEKWAVKLKHYDDDCVRFSGGWTSFCNDNCLIDASCLFEMVDKKTCVFKVTISQIVSSTSESEDEDSL